MLLILEEKNFSCSNTICIEKFSDRVDINWATIKVVKTSKRICDTLHELLPFVQFKHPSRSVTLSKVASWTPSWMFVELFKLHKWYQIAQNLSYRYFHFSYANALRVLSHSLNSGKEIKYIYFFKKGKGSELLSEKEHEEEHFPYRQF